jgi:hypothetical protein
MRAIGLVFVALSALLMACGPTVTGPTMLPGQPIPGVNLTGKWYSQQFGDMKLVQDKNIITGTYEDPRGPDHNGRIRGRLNADLLEVDWIMPGNPVAAIMPMRGQAKLRITHRGCKLEGQWGYDKTWHNGGAWLADKSQFAAGGEHCGDGQVQPEKKVYVPADAPIDGTTEDSLRGTEDE